ncbi:FtsX-like permease family protein [Streptomyces sp. NPDC046866]|uniref:FtsX-like permease family protein n=1 Tax=Streptomyces sp. NPDC046866 TaxID=3154921 RepID=UPI003453BB70
MSTPRAWARDLALGVRFAFTGGREGWIRTLLTGVGVGLGVALLLVTSAVPNALHARDTRAAARATLDGAATADAPGPNTLLTVHADQSYRSYGVDGLLVQPEGPKAPLPPGLKKYPGPGELAVSPALDRLLKTGEGALLRERLDGRIVSTIGDAGLVGPGELFFYAGTDRLAPVVQREPGTSPVQRITGFGNDLEAPPLDPVLTLLALLTVVALLMPVAVFIATAVRFGGERRDRRLAALRLVGADGRMTRRIAAGEALAGSAAGLLLGTGFFLAGRRLTPYAGVRRLSVFPDDLAPQPWLAAVIAVAVPAAAVAVTLFALRSVVIEPLGVVRVGAPRRRRIWWRLLTPLAGLGLLVPMTGRGNSHGRFNEGQVTAGVVLLLIGTTALLPYLLERIVARLGGAGPVSWQLAVRRLQLTSGAAARLVAGIAVAVAGAIALQMVFAGAERDYTDETGQDPGRAALSVLVRTGTPETTEALGRTLAGARGIARAIPLGSTTASRTQQVGEDHSSIGMTIGSCTALAELAELPSCADGDVFLLTGGARGTPGYHSESARAGEKLFTGNVYGQEGAQPVGWTVPAGARSVPARKDPMGNLRTGVLVTPAAAPKGLGDFRSAQVYLRLDPAVPDALERARTAVFKADPLAVPMTLAAIRTDAQYATVRSGLFVGSACVLVLIGCSLLVSQLEQLRERRPLLSALVAFGTRRSTLSLSVLWQTALPVGLGLALATAAGLGLGAVLMRMADLEVRIDWGAVAGMAGIGGAVVAGVTLLSLPPLLRLMRPDGLRTE